MKKLLFLLLFLTLYASAQAQIPPADVSGEWEIRLGVGPVLLVETNLGQVYRHVHYEQTALMEDGQYLQTRTEIGPCFPFGGPVLDGDIDDANVLTLNFTNGDQFAVLTSQSHLEIDDNRWDGTFTGTVCRQFYDTQPFIARRHLPFSSAYHRQARPPRAFGSLALLSGVTFQEGEKPQCDDHCGVSFTSRRNTACNDRL